MLAGTVALMFSTFLNPFFAAGATAFVLSMPALASHLVSQRWAYAIPVYALTRALFNANFTSPGTFIWPAVGIAVVETVAFWLLAGRIFAHVDIAVAVE